VFSLATICACAREGSAMALRVRRGSLHSADDGDFGEGEQPVAASDCSALQIFALNQVCPILYLQRILLVFSCLFKRFSVCGGLSSGSSKGLKANEEWRVDRCEVEGENKDPWSLIADGWGWLGGRISWRNMWGHQLGQVRCRSQFADLKYGLSKGRG